MNHYFDRCPEPSPRVEKLMEERNDFVIGLVLFLLASGLILVVGTFAISNPG